MSDCIFCQIIRHEIPSFKVYEDKNFLGFLDINPFTPGHTILIPKKHYRWVYDVPNFGEYWQVAQKIALNIKNSSLKPEYISFLTIGDEVPHAHIHVIPRYPKDNLVGIYRNCRLGISNEELKIIADKIKNDQSR